MRSSLKVMLCASLFCVVGVGVGVGAPVKKGPATPGAKSATELRISELYSTVPFDPTLEVLPSGYRGNDCKSVSKKLVSMKLSKDEFETSAVYNARIADLEDMPIDGQLSFSNYFAFAQEHYSITSTYDADSGLLEIKPMMRTHTVTLGKTRATELMIRSEIVKKSNYSGSNAFGVSAKVEKTEFYACALDLLDYPDEYRISHLRTSVAMSADDARTAKDNIGMLFVGKLARPFIDNYLHLSGPTIDDPKDIAWRGESIVMQSVEIWFYDKVTGKVYVKISSPRTANIR